MHIGLKTDATSAWPAWALKAHRLPVVCLDARHAYVALAVRPTKTDCSDARGLAEMVRMAWYREVQLKNVAAQEHCALLAARHPLVTIRVELDGQLQGMLKPFGLIVGLGSTQEFVQRAEALARKPAVILHCIWTDGTEFWWTKEAAMA